MRFSEFDQQQGASNSIRVREFGTADWNSSILVEEKNGYLMRRCVSLKDAHSHFASPCFLPHRHPPHFRRGFCIFIPEVFVRPSLIGFQVEGRSTITEVCVSSID